MSIGRGSKFLLEKNIFTGKSHYTIKSLNGTKWTFAALWQRHAI
jgi:hypothetical protein